MPTSHAPIKHDATFGMDYQSKPNLVAEGKWRTQFGMRAKDGKLVQVPRKIPYAQVISANHDYTIKSLVAVPAGSQGLSIPVALTDKSLYAFDSAGFRRLYRGFATSASQYLRWGTCVYNEFLYLVNPLNRVVYTNGSQVFALGPNVPMGRYVEVFFEHLVVANCTNDGSIEPTTVRWSSLYDFTNFAASQSSEADHYDFADYGRGDCGSVGISGLKRLGESLYVFTPTYIAPMAYVGLPTVVRVGEPVSKDVGNSFPYTVAATDRVAFFVDENARSFFAFDGAQVVDIGTPVSDWFFSSLSTVPTERFQTWAYIDPLYKEVHWVYISTAATGTGRFDSEVVFNYAEKSWYVAAVEDVHAFLPDVRVAKVANGTEAAVSMDSVVSDADVFSYKETLPRLWGYRNGRLLRDAVSGDLLANCLATTAPYLETPDYVYDSLQRVKEVETLTVHANAKDDSNVPGVAVSTCARSQLDAAVSFTSLGLWSTALPTGRMGGLHVGGRVHRHKFAFSSSAATSNYSSAPSPVPFVPKGTNGPVTAMCVDSAGRVYLAGCFTKYNNVTCSPGLIRVLATGAIDSTFVQDNLYIDVASAYPCPTQVFVSGSYVYVVAAHAYKWWAYTVKTKRTFGMKSVLFTGSLNEDGAWTAPPIVRFSLTGTIDTGWIPATLNWSNVVAADRDFIQAAQAHVNGRILVSIARPATTNGTFGAWNETAGAFVAGVLLPSPAAGRETSIKDFKCFPNGDICFVHQDFVDTGTPPAMAWTTDGTTAGTAVYSTNPEQGAMMGVLQMPTSSTMALDTGFVAMSKWEVDPGGNPKYGLNDIPWRMSSEIIKTSPVVATNLAAGDATYAGKFSTRAPGTQTGMVFWHGDPNDSYRCWDTSNGEFVETNLSVNGFYCPGVDNVGDPALVGLWADPWGAANSSTIFPFPLATLGSELESLDEGMLEPGVGVFVSGMVYKFKDSLMTGYCNQQTLRNGDAITNNFGYCSFSKVTALGDLDTSFAMHLYEYQDPGGGAQLSGIDLVGRKYPGAIFCATLMADKTRLLIGGMFTHIDGVAQASTSCNFAMLNALTGQLMTTDIAETDDASTVAYTKGGGVRDAVFSGFEENVRMGGER